MRKAKAANSAVRENGNPNPPAPSPLEPVAPTPEPPQAASVSAGLDSRQVSFVAPDFYKVVDRKTGALLFQGSFEGVERYLGWHKPPEADNQQVTVTFTRRELCTLISHVEIYLQNFRHDPAMEPMQFVHRKLVDLEERAVRGQGQARQEHEQPMDPYEAELRQRAAAKYPDPSPELAAKIEAKIQRLLQEHR